MSSEVLIPQVTLGNEEGYGLTATDGDVAISVRNVGKMYYLYDRPQDRLKQAFLWGRKQLYREFWALRDVSFEVRRGETLGIIGRNGAGKSTLLQILASTLKPTTGEVRVNGRVAAVLELGSGFNPEFTGRENVYMNSAILGFDREEIDELFDDIAAFADIGQFIDQPVKLYSSGMFVRLAFAVQAFVPKEILIVDEALAVGDEAFQRKCMSIMERFRDNGGTVLLVSHNTQTIVRQCERCLLFYQGQLLVDDDSKPVTDLYYKLMFSDAQKVAEILATLRQHGLRNALLHSQDGPQARNSTEPGDGPQITNHEQRTIDSRPADWFDPNMPKTNEVTYGNGGAEIFDYGMYNEQGEQVNVLVMGETYWWRYKVKFYNDAHKVCFGFTIKTIDGIDVAGVNNELEQQPIDFIASGSVVEAIFRFNLNLAPAMYFLTSGVSSLVLPLEDLYLHRRVDLCSLRVIPRDYRETYGFAYLEPSFTYRLLG